MKLNTKYVIYTIEDIEDQFPLKALTPYEFDDYRVNSFNSKQEALLAIDEEKRPYCSITILEEINYTY